MQIFVGVIIKDSKIGKIKFEYSKKANDLQEGDLLELNIGKKRLFYQVVIGITAEYRIFPCPIRTTRFFSFSAI